MLEPKKRKYRYSFRGRMKGVATSGNSLNFGEFGLKAVGRGHLTAAQIEAARRTITRYTKRGGKIWIRVFPDKPVTAKSAGSRMGTGKGEIKKYVTVITPGKMIFELTGVTPEDARKAFSLASAKLPFRTKIIERD